MPTPLGHSLWSISMYIFFRNKFKNIQQFKEDLLVIILCIIIGLFPDIDFIFFLFNHNPYLHRSITHSISFILIIALIGALILRRIDTIKRPYFLSFFLVAGHIFWDFFTKCDRVPYGTMFFWPFDNKYYQSPWFIFPGFGWWTLKELFSIYLLRQVVIEMAVFLPLLFLAIFVKKDKKSYL